MLLLLNAGCRLIITGLGLHDVCLYSYLVKNWGAVIQVSEDVAKEAVLALAKKHELNHLDTYYWHGV